MAFNPKFTITNALIGALTRIERVQVQGSLEAAKLSGVWIRKMQEHALVLEARHTTHIQGTHLTLAQSEKLLAGKKVKDADPDDARELLKCRAAFDLMVGYLGSGGPITEGLVREIHRRLVKGAPGDTAEQGAYDEVQNYMVNSLTGEVVYTPPPAHTDCRDRWIMKGKIMNSHTGDQGCRFCPSVAQCGDHGDQEGGGRR